MIDRAAARRAALDHIVDKFPELRGTIDIDDELTRDTGDGWLFQWNSVDYLRTRDHLDLLFGTVPVWVSSDGKQVELRSP